MSALEKEIRMKNEKIMRLVEKGWVIGNTENDEFLLEWLRYDHSDEEIKKLKKVQYDFNENGFSSTLGTDEENIANSSSVCEDRWEDTDEEFIDYLLSL